MKVLALLTWTQFFFLPVPTEPEPTTDYYLYLSWSFLLAVCMGQFGKSVYCKRIVEVLRNNWQEAEIQHEHQD